LRRAATHGSFPAGQRWSGPGTGHRASARPAPDPSVNC